MDPRDEFAPYNLPQSYPLLTPHERIQVLIYIKAGWKNATKQGSIEVGTYTHLRCVLTMAVYAYQHPIG